MGIKKRSIIQIQVSAGLWAQASQDMESLTTVPGGRASYAISTGPGVLLPRKYGSSGSTSSKTIVDPTARFVNDPAGQPILFTTGNPDRNYANLGVSLSATFRHGIGAFIDYQTVLGLGACQREFYYSGCAGGF